MNMKIHFQGFLNCLKINFRNCDEAGLIEEENSRTCACFEHLSTIISIQPRIEILIL